MDNSLFNVNLSLALYLLTLERMLWNTSAIHQQSVQCKDYSSKSYFYRPFIQQFEGKKQPLIVPFDNGCSQHFNEFYFVGIVPAEKHVNKNVICQWIIIENILKYIFHSANSNNMQIARALKIYNFYYFRIFLCKWPTGRFVIVDYWPRRLRLNQSSIHLLKICIIKCILLPKVKDQIAEVWCKVQWYNIFMNCFPSCRFLQVA